MTMEVLRKCLKVEALLMQVANLLLFPVSSHRLKTTGNPLACKIEMTIGILKKCLKTTTGLENFAL